MIIVNHKMYLVFQAKNKSLWFLVISRLQNRCSDAPFFHFANREICDTLYTRGPNFPYTKYGG